MLLKIKGFLITSINESLAHPGCEDEVTVAMDVNAIQSMCPAEIVHQHNHALNKMETLVEPGIGVLSSWADYSNAQEGTILATNTLCIAVKGSFAHWFAKIQELRRL